MDWLKLFALLAAVLLLAWAAGRVGRLFDGPNRRRGSSGVRGVKAVCSPAERAFLRVLESVVPDGTRILCMVRVADVIAVYGADFRTVSQKHFDFVICVADSFMPLLAIELDDKSHLTETQQRRDAVKNGVCLAAGLPILRVRPQATYDARMLKQLIAVELQRHGRS